METVDCILIPGIGPKKRQKLSDLGITNSAQLIEAYNRQDKNVKFVKSIVKRWIEEKGKESNYEFLKQIPQYVIEVNNTLIDIVSSMEM